MGVIRELSITFGPGLLLGSVLFLVVEILERRIVRGAEIGENFDETV